MNFTVDLAGIAGVIMAMIALIKVFFFSKYENTKTAAEAAASYAEAAKSAADRASASEIKISERDVKIDGLENRIVALEHILAIRDRYIAELLSGIGRLTHQLQSHQLEPVWKPEPMNENK